MRQRKKQSPSLIGENIARMLVLYRILFDIAPVDPTIQSSGIYAIKVNLQVPHLVSTFPILVEPSLLHVYLLSPS